MKTKNTKILIALCAGLTCLGRALAQDHHEVDRAHRWEFFLLGQYWTAEDNTVPNVTLPQDHSISVIPPATADVNFKFEGEFMYGFGFAYNFSDKLATRFEFTFGQPKYELEWNGSKVTGRAWVTTGKWNLEYNLLKRPLTPFISAGIGYSYIDTGIPSGPPEYWVWWDYFWGPIVTVSQPTVTEWSFNYNAAAGLRWDISDVSVVRLAVTSNWIDMDSAAGTEQTIETTLSYSWKW
jgi:opacity protein-like surface antigen